MTLRLVIFKTMNDLFMFQIASRFVSILKPWPFSTILQTLNIQLFTGRVSLKHIKGKLTKKMKVESDSGLSERRLTVA